MSLHNAWLNYYFLVNSNPGVADLKYETEKGTAPSEEIVAEQMFHLIAGALHHKGLALKQ